MINWETWQENEYFACVLNTKNKWFIHLKIVLEIHSYICLCNDLLYYLAEYFTSRLATRNSPPGAIPVSLVICALMFNNKIYIIPLTAPFALISCIIFDVSIFLASSRIVCSSNLRICVREGHSSTTTICGSTSLIT